MMDQERVATSSDSWPEIKECIDYFRWVPGYILGAITGVRQSEVSSGHPTVDICMRLEILHVLGAKCGKG